MTMTMLDVIGQCVHCGGALTIGHRCFNNVLEHALALEGLSPHIPAVPTEGVEHAVRGAVCSEQTGSHDRGSRPADGSGESEAAAKSARRYQVAPRTLLGVDADQLTKEQLLARFNEAAHNVAELASDLLLACGNPEFAEFCGGTLKLAQDVKGAVKLWERCMDDAYLGMVWAQVYDGMEAITIHLHISGMEAASVLAGHCGYALNFEEADPGVGADYLKAVFTKT